MNWLDSASRWIIEAYREGLVLSCPHQCRERANQRRKQLHAALRQKKRRLFN
ncbi:MAG: hypothetical protein KGL48_16100 [Sphingomonadales bacterium]|nr:hypothetical protein [Sphingomonadales bacterium]MDE2569124.1 hypothetical protein [Sphingomonadales bacterium]